MVASSSPDPFRSLPPLPDHQPGNSAYTAPSPSLASRPSAPHSSLVPPRGRKAREIPQPPAAAPHATAPSPHPASSSPPPPSVAGSPPPAPASQRGVRAASPPPPLLPLRATHYSGFMLDMSAGAPRPVEDELAPGSRRRSGPPTAALGGQTPNQTRNGRRHRQ